jgi:hypothetical protein
MVFFQIPVVGEQRDNQPLSTSLVADINGDGCVGHPQLRNSPRRVMITPSVSGRR